MGEKIEKLSDMSPHEIHAVINWHLEEENMHADNGEYSDAKYHQERGMLWRAIFEKVVK